MSHDGQSVVPLPDIACGDHHHHHHRDRVKCHLEAPQAPVLIHGPIGHGMYAILGEAVDTKRLTLVTAYARSRWDSDALVKKIGGQPTSAVLLSVRPVAGPGSATAPYASVLDLVELADHETVTSTFIVNGYYLYPYRSPRSGWFGGEPSVTRALGVGRPREWLRGSVDVGVF